MKKECTILIGMSASGKTAVLKNLCEKYNFHKLVTTTTRDKRVKDNEQEGIDYFFVSKEEFNSMDLKNELFERIEFENQFYGLSKKAFKNIPKNKKPIVILDPVGAKAVKKIMEAENWKINTVFIEEELETIFERINKREDKVKNKARIENVKTIEKNWPSFMEYDLKLKPNTTIEDRVNKVLIFTTPTQKKKSKYKP